MKAYKIIRFSSFSLLLVLFCAFTSCSDWTQMESVESNVSKPWEQDPALWAQYTAALRAYKQTDHFLVYARLNNSPKVATSEKDFMRSLPDSLDVVTLTNADNFSALDGDDLTVMREKGTRVLYQVDYAARAAEFADATALGTYLDGVVAAVAARGLDGYSFTGALRMEDAASKAAAALLVSKLGADETKLLVFEGNPLFVAEADRAKIDYFVLDTERTEQVLDVQLQVLYAVEVAGVPATKLLLAAEIDAPLNNEENEEQPAIAEMTRRVISAGPLAGLGVYNISGDYYNSDINYRLIRQAIQTLNPSK
ncbi:MAG: glycoside hydrolase family 18 [Alistipes sp.]